MSASDDVISVPEAAGLAGKSTQGFYRAIRLGHVPAGVYWRVGRDIYVSRERLLEWRNAGGNAALMETAGACSA